jgi:hypothetical protein
VVCGIDRYGLVREEGVEGRKAAFDEGRRFCVVGEVDPVEEVRAVARVGPDGRREPLLREVGRDPLRRSERRVVLGVVDETPLGRTGSMSTGSQRRRMMSASAVVASFRESRILIRFARRARRAGFTAH